MPLPVGRPFLAALALLVLTTAPASAANPAELGCRPEMAQDWPAGGPRLIRAALKPDEVRLTFVGHATFLIETPKGVTAATDYNDYIRPDVTPVIATMNQAHSTHHSTRPDPGIRHLLRGWDPSGGRAAHDLTVDDLRVRNVPTNLRDWERGGTLYDGNSIFVFEVGELCIGHLGHLHHTLEPEHIRAIGRLDVVLAPVDGGYTLDREGMVEVLNRLQTRLIVPMHYFGPTTLARFLERISNLFPVERRAESTLVISRATLPARPTVVVLPAGR